MLPSVRPDQQGTFHQAWQPFLIALDQGISQGNIKVERQKRQDVFLIRQKPEDQRRAACRIGDVVPSGPLDITTPQGFQHMGQRKCAARGFLMEKGERLRGKRQLSQQLGGSGLARVSQMRKSATSSSVIKLKRSCRGAEDCRYLYSHRGRVRPLGVATFSLSIRRCDSSQTKGTKG